MSETNKLQRMSAFSSYPIEQDSVTASEIGLIVSVVSVILVFLSWRAASITSIEDKETILHQRFGSSGVGGSKIGKNGNFVFKINGMSTHENLGQDWHYGMKLYITGEATGGTQFVLQFPETDYVPSIEELRDHPWYEDLELEVVNADQKSSPSITIAIWSVEPAEVDEQLRLFCQLFDHVLSGKHIDDPASIPENPCIEREGMESSPHLSD